MSLSFIYIDTSWHTYYLTAYQAQSFYSEPLKGPGSWEEFCWEAIKLNQSFLYIRIWFVNFYAALFSWSKFSLQSLGRGSLEGFLELFSNFTEASKTVTMKYHKSKLFKNVDHHQRTCEKYWFNFIALPKISISWLNPFNIPPPSHTPTISNI